MGLFDAILKQFSNREIDWDELEEILIGADLGAPLAMSLVQELQSLGRTLRAEQVTAQCRQRIEAILATDPPATWSPLAPGEPRVILVCGVNGTGKTTSVAKLAHFLTARNYSVMLAAADTFRAAAIEQLQVWADRIGVPLIKTHYQGDPSAVCYDAYEAAARRNIDFLICDTAGRLHNRANLMEEMRKVRRTLAKRNPEAPHDRLLVVDATTGSNALAQAREFHAALDLTGLIMTKLDGSGKGGMVVAIQDQLGIPTRFVGTGEQIGDFSPFAPERFVATLL
jgi:fused signal recognition particle receptor